jgi:hypothetical protein
VRNRRIIGKTKANAISDRVSDALSHTNTLKLPRFFEGFAGYQRSDPAHKERNNFIFKVTCHASCLMSASSLNESGTKFTVSAFD